MDRILETYLADIDRYLRPLPPSERIDIIQEIKSNMVELEKNEGLTPQQIVDKLGSPKDMAKAYLGDLISKSEHFSWNRLLTLMAFYSAAGFSGMIVLPFLGILAPTLQFCGIIVPIAGMIKLIGFICHFDVPFVMMQVGAYEAHPIVAFIVSLVVGGLLYRLGQLCWKWLKQYMQTVSNAAQKLSL